MAWHTPIWHWLVHAALGSFAVLGLGALAVRLCRQPVRQLRLIELTLLGCLLVPWLGLVPGLPRWSAGLLEEPPAPGDEPAPAPGEWVVGAGTTELSVPARTPPPAAEPAEAAGPAALPSPAPPAAPAAAPPAAPAQAPPRIDIQLSLLIVLAYAGLAAGSLLWWSAGLARLLLLCRGTRPAPPRVAALFRDVAGPAGRGVRLLVGDRLESPVTFGRWRPVIVLPAGLCREDDPAALRCCLAHEWSHVERRDAGVWYVAGLVQVLFFYQPLFWLLRRRLRLCQDFLADARAAEQAAAAEDYAEYLVRLARRRLRAPALAALGLGDRRSNLYRRVLMLVDNREPLERRCLRPWNLAVTLAAVVLVGAVASVRLDAGDQKEAPQKEGPKDPDQGETLKYTGKVTDKTTGKPIEGATVTVRRSVLGKPEQEHKVLQETKHQTDAEGKYSFTIPPEQAAERYLYIELDVTAPNHAPQMGFGYALSMIRKNEKMGGRPFFEHVELRPGEEVSGRVETPDGKPAAGVRVLAFSKPAGGDFREYGSFARGKTDDKGVFRMTVVKGGAAVFWLLPENYAPSLHVVKKAGDQGLLGLQKGLRLKGKVVDAKGKPLAGVYVSVNREGRDEELAGLNVADSIRRTAQTNDQGEFEAAPLPAGTYRVHPDEHAYDWDERKPRRPLPAVFVAQKVMLKADEEPQSLEVRAVPHVTIEAQYFDSKGQPKNGHEVFVAGRIDGGFWGGMARPDAKGKVVLLVPHGMQETQLDLMTNEHGVLRHRKSKDGPLENARRVNLGTVNDDVKGIEIIRYEAPVVLVKAAAKDGGKLKDVVVTAEYAEGKGTREGKFIIKNGAQSEVLFEEQEDGRFRSSQMLPDEDVTVTVQAEGYAPRSEKVKLAEGATKELEVVLEKK